MPNECTISISTDIASFRYQLPHFLSSARYFPLPSSLLPPSSNPHFPSLLQFYSRSISRLSSGTADGCCFHSLLTLQYTDICSFPHILTILSCSLHVHRYLICCLPEISLHLALLIISRSLAIYRLLRGRNVNLHR